MKKLLVVAGLASIATAAVAADAPTVYGQINKEVRYVKQHSRERKNSFSNAVDVQGYETRLGVKGSQKTEASIADAVDYNLELGINSQTTSALSSGYFSGAADERIRVRLANAVLKTSYGNLAVGKMWHSGALRVVAADPFANTSASIANLGDNGDLAFAVNANIPVIGAHTRLLNDMIQYGIAWNGFKYVFESDRNDRADLTKGNASATNSEINWSTHNVFWDGKLADVDLKASVIYAKGDTQWTSANESYLQSAFQADLANGLGMSLGYGTRTVYKAGNDTKFDIKNLMAAAKYKWGAWTFAATYGLTDLGNTKYASTAGGAANTYYAWGTAATGNDGISRADELQGKLSQITIGARHQCGEMVTSTLAYKRVSRSLEASSTSGTATGSSLRLRGAGEKHASADVIVAGITVKF